MQDTSDTQRESNLTVETGTSAAPELVADAPPDAPLGPAPGESDRAWEAFRVYLELGPQRRYIAVSRKVGASLRTIRRWASQFDWRGRIHASTGRQIEQYEEAQSVLKCEEALDATARAQALRDRQYAVAEAMLDAAERYLARVGDDDPDQMSFSDACKALAVAARVAQPAAGPHANDPSAPVRSLRDQLAVLLDQAYSQPPVPSSNAT